MFDVPGPSALWVEVTAKTSAVFEQHLFASGLKEKMDKGLCSSEGSHGPNGGEDRAINALRFRSRMAEEYSSPKAEMMPLLTTVTEVFPSELLSNTDPIHHAVARNSSPGWPG